MNKELIMEKASKNEELKRRLKIYLESSILKLINKDLDGDWIFDTQTNCYTKWLDFERNWDFKFRDNKLKFSIFDCTVEAAYEHWNDTTEAKIFIPMDCENEVIKPLVDKLNSKRTELKKRWREMMGKIGVDYFNLHKEEFSKYPLAGALHSHRICVWTNGADNVKPCHKMVELMNHSINHGLSESLNDTYDPAIWKDNNTTDATIFVGNGILCHFHRNYEITENTFSYPAIFIEFEMVSSEDDVFNAILTCKQEQDRVNAYTHLMHAIDHFKMCDWFLNENGNPEAIVPIIWDEDAEFIKKRFEEIYDEFNVSLTKEEIPLFDNNIHTCLKVECR